MRADRVEVDRRRRRAGAESRALVALLHHGVVAVPVQLHALARLRWFQIEGKSDARVLLAFGQRVDR